jgi:hypothetical protein
LITQQQRNFEICNGRVSGQHRTTMDKAANGGSGGKRPACVCLRPGSN